MYELSKLNDLKEELYVYRWLGELDKLYSPA